jgi:hypothetical protein
MRSRLLLLVPALLWLGIGQVHAQSHPILDRLAQRVVEKYRSSSCDQIAAMRSQPKSQMEQRFVQAMHQNPQLRTEFLNRVAGPIANRLFECGLIP